MTNPSEIMFSECLDAWLLAIARDGWSGARIDAVADLAGSTPAAVAADFPDRWSALAGLQRRLDVATLAEAGPTAGQACATGCSRC